MNNVITLDEVRAQIAVREKEMDPHNQMDPCVAAIGARDEALERLCEALAYLQRSLEEVGAARSSLDRQHEATVRDVIESKGEVERLKRELKFALDQAGATLRELDIQRAKQQRAFAEAKQLRDELRSVRIAGREVGRQMGALLNEAERVVGEDGVAEEAGGDGGASEHAGG